MDCPVCAQAVKISGNVTMYYIGIERLKTWEIMKINCCYRNTDYCMSTEINTVPRPVCDFSICPYIKKMED